VRNALILLAVVAVIILAVGALNNGTAFEIDYVAGTMSEVSLFWVSLVIAAIVFVAGLAAAWFALSGAAGGRRKLEAELQSTYERLRETEREAGEARASAAAAAAASAAARPTPEIVEATVVAEREESTIVVAEAVTVVIDEPETVVTEDTPSDEPGAGSPAEADETPAEGELTGSAGEQTAVTVAAPAPEPAEAAETGDGEAPAESPAPDEAPAADGGSQDDAPAESAGDVKQ